MTASSIKRRRIDVTISLGEGQFGETLGDTVVLPDLRVMAYIAYVGGEAQGQCQARIFGLPLSTINQLTTIGPVGWQIKGKNSIAIAAGDDGASLTTIFTGTIIDAWGEMGQAPNVGLSVWATSAAVAALKPSQASSYTGATDVATIMQTLAATGGFKFENNGVQATLDSPYLYGTVYDQIRQVGTAARIGWTVQNGTLAIWPATGYRAGDVPVLSPGAGLVGYPSFNERYMGVRSTFLPAAQLGGLFTVQGSSIAPANGTWNIASVNHSLESQVPNGQWFTDIQGWSNGN